MGELILSIDIGTSACKVVLFESSGAVVAQEIKEYPILYPREGWAEQDPEMWWQAACLTIQKVFGMAGRYARDVACIGVAGQSWSAIPINKNGEVLSNTPIWMDRRSEDICKQLINSIGEENIFSLSGNRLQPMYTLPKICWYRRHRPQMYKSTYKILQSNSFIVYRLTGILSQDISQGYGYHCFNMERGQFDKDMCREMGIDMGLIPDLFPCHRIVGTITQDAADKTGLKSGIPVVAGGLDAACATLGAGVIQEGQVQEQGGQAGGMSICIGRYKPVQELVISFHVIPGKWLLQGATVGGGGIMKWFEREFAAAEKVLAKQNNTNSFIEMDKKAGEIPPASDGLIFLPYMAGERSPIWNSQAKGVYYGLDFSKTRGHMIRGSMEGVAFSLRHNLEVAEKAGVFAGTLNATGGSANSHLWTQIKSDVTGKPIQVPEADTATALGAALLAGVGTGIYKNFEEAVANTVKIKRKHVPNRSNKEKYDKAYTEYRALYNNLKEMMEG